MIEFTKHAADMHELPLAATADELAAVTHRIAQRDLIALDTEFIREKTYFPLLCLIQVACGDLVAAVDCLAGLDADEFFGTLLAPERTWVLHSARQDLEVVWNLTERLPGRLIDTQIAAALLGMAPQTSLQKLLESTLGVEVEKDQTRADWQRRPVAEAALAYALNDVRYLLDAWRVLAEKLAAAGRMEWLDEECARLLAIDPSPAPAAVLERIKGIGGLTPAERRVALALVEWREEHARKRNRPRRWILADDVLLKLARARPATRPALAAVGGLPGRLAERHGAALLAAIEHGPALTLPAALDEQRQDRRPDKLKLKSIQGTIRQRAESLGIAAELLATRRDMVAIEAGQPPEHLTSGWRAAVLADVI